MPTNLQIDDSLLTEALALGGEKTKRATVNAALKEFVDRRKRQRIWELEGEVEFHPDYDYKKQRRAR